MSDVFEINLATLTYRAECEWLQKYRAKHGATIDKHPLYEALCGNVHPLDEWCTAQGNIWVPERLTYLFEVYKSLIMYGQTAPIVITQEQEIVTGHKRSCCMLRMGFKTIKAIRGR